MHNVLRAIVQRIDVVSEFLGMAARWAVLAMMFVMLYEAVGRYLFNAPTIWAHELSQLLWGFYMLLGGIYVLRHDAHVNFDLIHRKVSPRKRATLDSITYLIFFVFCVAVLWFAVPYAWESMMRLECSRTQWAPPIWPLKMLVPVAVSLLLLQGVAKYIRSLYTALSGRELV